MSDSSYTFYVIDPDSIDKNKCNWSDNQKKSCFEAFDILKENFHSPKWLKEESCLREARRRRCYFIFGKFEGVGFDHLVSINAPIYGTPVIIAFKGAGGTRNNLPYPSTPLYSVHFLKKRLTFTGLSLEENEMYAKLFSYMGGEASSDLMESTNILICNNCDRNSSKYVEMAKMKRFVCQPKLITETFEKALEMEIFNAGEDEYLHKYTAPLLADKVFCVSGLRPSSRHDVQNLVEVNGGKYTGHMKNGEATHLLCEEASGRKYKKALEWNIVIVKSSWLADSINSGYLLPYEKYSLTNKQRTCSTPNTSKAPNITIGEENISSIQNDAPKINLKKLDKKLSIFPNKDSQLASNKSARRKTSTFLGNESKGEIVFEDPANERTIDDVVHRYMNEENSRQASGLPSGKRSSSGNLSPQIFQGKTFRSLDNENDNLKDKVEKLGGTYVNDDTTLVDYIYFPVIMDTMKSFTGSNCRNKVSDLWLIDCLEKKVLLDPSTNPFYVPLYIDVDRCSQLLKSISQCIMAIGGDIVYDNQINSLPVTHIITCKPVDDLTKNTSFSKANVVNYIWLTESVSNCFLQNEEDFVFETIPTTTRKDVCWLTWHHEDEGSKENDDDCDMLGFFRKRMSLVQRTSSLETPLKKMSTLELSNSLSRQRRGQTKSLLPRDVIRVSNTDTDDYPSSSSKISTPSALLNGERMRWNWNRGGLDCTPEKNTELTESFVTNVIDQNLKSIEDHFLNESITSKGPTDFTALAEELEKSGGNITPKHASSPCAKKRKLSIISKTSHSSNLTKLSSRRKAAKSTLLKSPFKPEVAVNKTPKSPLADPTNIQFTWLEPSSQKKTQLPEPSRSQIVNVKESFGRIIGDESHFDEDDSTSTIFFQSSLCSLDDK